MSKNKYLLNVVLETLSNNGYTKFLDPLEYSSIKNDIKEYNVFKPTIDSEKVIIYDTKKPNIIVFEVMCDHSLRHQDILGSLYNLNINSNLFGDIIRYNDTFYIILLEEIAEYVKYSLTKISKYNVSLKEVFSKSIYYYEKEYDRVEVIVPNERIDSILSKVTKKSRSHIQDLILDKEVVLNYEVLRSKTKTLVEGDTFSCRGLGKYKYNKFIRKSNNNYVISILKYK